MINGYRISACEDEVLDIDGNDGCKTMRMYLRSLTYTVEMFKMVNFMLCIFHQNKKINSVHYTKIIEV